MKTAIQYIFFTYLVFISFSLKAQEEEIKDYRFIVQAQTYQDSVVLRWVPNSNIVWQAMNKYGVVVERLEPGEQVYRPLISTPLFPYTLEQWKSRTDTTNVHVTTAAQCLLGEEMMKADQAQSLSQKLLTSQEQQNRLALAAFSAEFSVQAANGLAMRFVDKSAIEPAYKYRVRIDVQPANFVVEPGIVKVNTAAHWKPRGVQGLQIENGDGKVTLTWPKAGNNGTFSGYYIERGDKKGKNFERLNEIIYKTGTFEDNRTYNEYVDRIEEYEQEYTYRVVGITSFADEGLYSEVVTGKSIDLRAPAPPDLVVVKAQDDSTFLITWQENKPAPEDHIGYYIGRGTNIKGPFDIINEEPLSVQSRSFVDQDPVMHRANYYILISEDKSGNTAQSFASMGVLPDATPPAKPTGLLGKVDTLGVVSLAWEFGNEPDLMGYRVYRSNGKKRDYIQITKTPIPGNFYRDTINLKTLTEQVYYTIAAFDFNYNPSEYSDTLMLKRPDFVPPVSPQFKDYKTYSDSVTLQWIPSSSNDVVSQVLYRKQLNSEWTPIAYFDTAQTSYSDTTVNVGNVYQYAMVAVDDARLLSKKSFAITAHVNDDSYRGDQPKLTGFFDEQSKSFRLSWQINAAGNYRINIYRNSNLQGMRFYASASSDQSGFEDKAFFQNDNGYEYAIKAIYDDGGESPFSNKVAVNLK